MDRFQEKDESLIKRRHHSGATSWCGPRQAQTVEEARYKYGHRIWDEHGSFRS